MSFTLTLNDHFGPTLESNLLAGDHKMYNLRGKLLIINFLNMQSVSNQYQLIKEKILKYHVYLHF